MLRRLEAGEDPLELSIQKWQDIVDGKGTNDLGKNCALCEVNDECNSCIIYQTLEKRCAQTPYHDYILDPTKENAMKELEFLKSLRKK